MSEQPPPTDPPAMTLYDEHLWMPWWATALYAWWAIGFGVAASLFLPGVVKVVPALAFLGALVLVLRYSRGLHVRVDDEFLHAGRLHVRLADIVKLSVLSKRHWSKAKWRGRPGLSPFWMPSALRLELAHPPGRSAFRFVLVGTRHPDELAQVLEQAVMKARGLS